jgi:hypothetical protein
MIETRRSYPCHHRDTLKRKGDFEPTFWNLNRRWSGFLLIERLSYFARIIQGKPEKYLISMFDVFSRRSPRGFALATIRDR